VAGCASLNSLTGGAPGAAASQETEAHKGDTATAGVATAEIARVDGAKPDTVTAAPLATVAATDHARPEGDRLTGLVKGAFATAKLTGTPAISPVRPTHDNQWGDYVFCITSTDPAPKYAVLVTGTRVLEVRTSIVVDGCEGETYTPLAPPQPAKKRTQRR
jgi:hypothetical protein